MQRGSSAWRERHWKRCGDADIVEHVVKPGIRLWCAAEAREAFDVLTDTFAFYGYVLRPKKTGVYNCRKITNGTSYSSHAYGTSLDANWDTNPYVKGRLVTDMPREMVQACLEIRTTEGVQVFRWGGDWDNRPDTPHKFYDAMHWEIIATPEELAAGIERSVDAPVERVAVWPTLRRGSRGPAVVRLQAARGLEEDGIFGEHTETAVIGFQLTRGLEVDGWVGPATWTAIEHNLPILAAGEIGPNKKLREAA